MLTRTKIIVLFLCFDLCLVLTTCISPPSFSLIPSIKEGQALRAAESSNIDAVIISFSFEDGDGDIGLSDMDSLPPFSQMVCEDNINSINCPLENQISNRFRFNYFLTIFKLNDEGLFEEVIFPDNTNYNGRIPRLPDNDASIAQPLSGNIRFTISLLYDFATSPINSGDVLAFEIQIADRALNLSSIIRTNTIMINP